jgi:hypothetical protein
MGNALRWLRDTAEVANQGFEAVLTKIAINFRSVAKNGTIATRERDVMAFLVQQVICNDLR